MKISVIICTHNPREDYLQRTLDALREQTFPKEEWELLLIDNASEILLSDKWDLNWHPHARHIREEELGLTPARLRGITESNGEVLVFVDDDNLLDEDYLEKSIQLLADNSKLGCIGAGIITPEFEKEPEAHLKKYCDCLALRVIPKADWSNTPEKANRPYGAGLVVIRNVADKFVLSINSNLTKKSLGRNGENLMSCEDDEFSFVSCQMGFGIGVFPDLKVMHLIPKKRVELDYLIKIMEGHAYSKTLLYKEHDLPIPFYQKDSKFSEIICSALRLKLSTTIYHLHSWWFARQTPHYEKIFRAAWAKGVIKLLTEQN